MRSAFSVSKANEKESQGREKKEYTMNSKITVKEGKNVWNIKEYSQISSFIPIVNANSIGIERNGKRYIITGAACAKELTFFILDLETNKSERYTTADPRLKDKGGTYAVMEGADGKIYLNSSRQLLSFEFDVRKFEILMEKETNGVIWGGLATRSGHIYLSHTPGEFTEFEIKTKRILRQNYHGTREALYGHSWLELPDGRALCAVECPQAEVVVFVPGKPGENILAIPQFKGRSAIWVRGLHNGKVLLQSEDLLIWLDPVTLVVAEEKIVYVIRSDKETPSHFQAESFNSQIMGWDPEGSLLVLDNDRWRVLAENCLPPQPARFSRASWGDLILVGVEGDCLVYNGNEIKTYHINTAAAGAMPIIGLAGDKNKIYGSTFINQHFFSIDRLSGVSQDLGQACNGGGQVNNMVCHNDKVYMASYAGADIIEYDPSHPVENGKNPHVIVNIGHEQMRPIGMLSDNERIWVTTHAKYGKLGGAVTWFNPLTGEFKVCRPAEGLNMEVLLLYKPDQMLVIGSSIEGDGGSVKPKEETASLFLWNMAGDSYKRITPSVKVKTLRPILVTPGGSVLVCCDEELYSWFNLKTGQFGEWKKRLDDPLPDPGVVWLDDHRFIAAAGGLTLWDIKNNIVTRWGNLSASSYNGRLVCLETSPEVKVATVKNGWDVVEYSASPGALKS